MLRGNWWFTNVGVLHIEWFVQHFLHDYAALLRFRNKVSVCALVWLSLISIHLLEHFILWTLVSIHIFISAHPAYHLNLVSLCWTHVSHCPLAWTNSIVIMILSWSSCLFPLNSFRMSTTDLSRWVVSSVSLLGSSGSAGVHLLRWAPVASEGLIHVLVLSHLMMIVYRHIRISASALTSRRLMTLVLIILPRHVWVSHIGIYFSVTMSIIVRIVQLRIV